ncbi:hypothetical protein PBNK5_32830 [Pectobacterium brasiliense]
MQIATNIMRGVRKSNELFHGKINKNNEKPEFLPEINHCKPDKKQGYMQPDHYFRITLQPTETIQ